MKVRSRSVNTLHGWDTSSECAINRLSSPCELFEVGVKLSSACDPLETSGPLFWMCRRKVTSEVPLLNFRFANLRGRPVEKAGFVPRLELVSHTSTCPHSSDFETCAELRRQARFPCLSVLPSVSGGAVAAARMVRDGCRCCLYFGVSSSRLRLPRTLVP